MVWSTQYHFLVMECHMTTCSQNTLYTGALSAKEPGCVVKRSFGVVRYDLSCATATGSRGKFKEILNDAVKYLYFSEEDASRRIVSLCFIKGVDSDAILVGTENPSGGKVELWEIRTVSYATHKMFSSSDGNCAKVKVPVRKKQ